MENELVKYVSKFMTLTAEEKRAIEENIAIRTFKKGTVLLKEGEISTKCYFNLKGLVMQYYLVDAEEKATFFYLEEQAINSFESATQKIPAKHYLVCLEDTTLVVGDLEEELDFYKKYPRFEAFSRMMVQDDFGKAQEHMAHFITSSPEQRYLHLLKTQPQLMNRVPQYHLASYLGITPESLSRIRKRTLLSH
jgi:CRP-like cAMP-binding protein